MTGAAQPPRLSVLVLAWRDTGHPDGGGSEVYVDHVIDGLAAAGHRVVLFTAAYDAGRASDRRPSGVEVRRRGGRFSVYLFAWAYVRRNRREFDVVIEVHNGVPFLAQLASGHVPVLVLVHHVHREQWSMVMAAPLARVGWFLESSLAPRVNRRAPYVTVSAASRDDLVSLGIDATHIHVIKGATPPLTRPAAARSSCPHLAVVGRLVPHKRVELALQVAAELLGEYPDLQLSVVGDGWWAPQLSAAAAELPALTGHVIFHGQVTDDERDDIMARSWVCLVPSVKEGWGLVVTEAARFATPSVAFWGSGGLESAILDGRTGLLALPDDAGDLVNVTRHLIADQELREQLGRNARLYATQFTWEDTARSFTALVLAVAAGVNPTNEPQHNPGDRMMVDDDGRATSPNKARAAEGQREP